MTTQAFRLDMPFKSPTNAGEFGAVYFQAMAQQDPKQIAPALERIPWLTWLATAAPFVTADPLEAMTWIKCALDLKARRNLIAALQELDKVIEASEQ